MHKKKVSLGKSKKWLNYSYKLTIIWLLDKQITIEILTI